MQRKAAVRGNQYGLPQGGCLSVRLLRRLVLVYTERVVLSEKRQEPLRLLFRLPELPSLDGNR
jgi:hypothetical protein